MNIKNFELKEIINKLELYENREKNASAKLRYTLAINFIKGILYNEQTAFGH